MRKENKFFILYFNKQNKLKKDHPQMLAFLFDRYSTFQIKIKIIKSKFALVVCLDKFDCTKFNNNNNKSE